MRQLTLLLMTVSLLVGGVPQKISYQGYITHADGSLVSDGSYDVKFRLFQANEGGDALWEESQSLTIGSGLISATLGNSIALNFSENMHFLEIEIGGEVLTPRQELTTVFYAFHAESAVNAATANLATKAAKSDTATYATKSGNADLATKATTADTAFYSKASVVVSVGNLSDVDLTNIADGKILKYDGTNTKFVVSDDAITTNMISMSDTDADTKIQLEETSNEDKIRFDTGGSERMIIDEAGNIGIGTTSPGSELDVNGTLRLSGSTSGFVGLKGATAAGSTTFTLPSVDGSSGQVISTDGSGTLSWSSVSGSGVLSNATTTIGSGSAAANLASSGDHDLVLKTGNSTTGTITITDGANGNIAVTPNGTGEVDISKVDIDAGAIDGTAIGANSASTGAFSTVSASGVVTANAGVVVDNITIDGTEIDLSSGDLTLDVAGDIYLNADGGNILFQDGSADLMEIDANSRISLSNNDSGTSNTLFGKSAGASLDAGSNYNVFIGDAVSDATMDDATLNVGLGSSALSALTTGDKNVATGYKSLFSNTTGTYNTSIGTYALQLNTTGKKNIAIGGGALDVSDEEDHNLAIGYDALGGAIAGGEYNVAVGNYSLDANTSGGWNTAVGYDVMTTNIGGDKNTSIGFQSLQANTEGNKNVAVGMYSMYANTTASDNIAVGYESLKVNTTGTQNAAVGYGSLDANTTGTYNTALGYASLGANTTASYNTAIGWQSMLSTAGAGTFNTGVGARSLETNTTGDDNTAVGVNSMFSNSTGNENTGAGRNSLYGTTGSYNTSFGWYSGNEITSGTYNTVLGHNASASGATAVQQIVIGAGATGTGDNYAVIGNSSITRVYAAQDGEAVLYANGTINSSDRRIKRNIEDVSFGLNYITSLRPVTYYKKHPRDYPQELKDTFYPDGKVREVSAEDNDKRQIGLIAQEVQDVNEKLGVENNIVSIDEDGFHRMDYAKLVVPLIKAVQELSAKVDKLESQLEANSAEVSASQ